MPSHAGNHGKNDLVWYRAGRASASNRLYGARLKSMMEATLLHDGFAICKPELLECRWVKTAAAHHLTLFRASPGENAVSDLFLSPTRQVGSVHSEG